MQQALDAIQTALRVLTAITEGATQKHADVEKLRRFAPLLADAPPEELAFAVLQQAMKRAQLAVRNELGAKKRKADLTSAAG